MLVVPAAAAVFGAFIYLAQEQYVSTDDAFVRAAKVTDHYTFATTGTITYEPKFTQHGFRYVEVTGVEQPPGADALTGIVIHSDTPLTGSFSCSNEMVNQLHSNIVWGQDYLNTFVLGENIVWGQTCNDPTDERCNIVWGQNLVILTEGAR